MVQTNKFNLKKGDKIKYKNKVYLIISISLGEYVVIDKECEDSKYRWCGRCPILTWEQLDYAMKVSDKKDMEERLKELKEKITSFVNDYNIKDFYIDINEDIDLVSKDTYETQSKVNIEIRV